MLAVLLILPLTGAVAFTVTAKVTCPVAVAFSVPNDQVSVLVAVEYAPPAEALPGT